MGIIDLDQLTDLTDTSFASSYAVVEDDDGDSAGSDDGGSGAAAAGVTCKLPDFYADG